MTDFNSENTKNLIQHSSGLDTTPDIAAGDVSSNGRHNLRNVVLGITGLGLATAAVLGINNARENNGPDTQGATNPDKTTSATAPESWPSIPGQDLSSFNTRPGVELVKLAQEPILAKDYTPDGALNRLIGIENVYFTGGLYDAKGHETPASKEAANKIYENIYGSPQIQVENQTTPAELGHDDVRSAVSREFSQLYAKGSHNSAPATWRANCVETSLNITDIETLWYGSIECEVQSNFHDIDPQYPQSAPPREVSIRLQNIDGQYFITYRK